MTIAQARTKMRHRLGVLRRGPRDVAATDKRTPLLRLMQDGQTPDGHVYVNYAAQWPTVFKAQRLGYLDDEQKLTEAGRTFLSLSVAS